MVPRLYEGPQAFTLQTDDRRIVFIIPYQDDFTLIGTTDIPFTGDPSKVSASDAEVHYLCDLASEYLKTGTLEGFAHVLINLNEFVYVR